MSSGSRTGKRQWDSLKNIGLTLGLFFVVFVAGLLFGW